MLRLLRKDYKGVLEMKRKLVRSVKVMMMLGLLLGMSQTGWAEESVVPAEKTVATTETSSTEAVQESTEPATTASQPESVPESSISKDEVQTIEDDVDALIKDQLGEKTGDEIQLDQEYSASNIRKYLLEADYGISKEALDKYTDAQLEDTMTLFERYNYDVIGMYFGAYVRLLNTLYVDKTVSIENALAQLSYNPGSFNSFAEMIPQVDKLQAYLKALYPSNSSFFAGKEMSNDELIATLTHLDGFERQVKEEGRTLVAGRIAYILNADAYGMTTDPTNSATSDSQKAGESEVPADTSKDEDKQGGFLKLPQTGEEKAKWAVSILGLVVVVVVVIYVARRNKVSKHK